MNSHLMVRGRKGRAMGFKRMCLCLFFVIGLVTSGSSVAAQESDPADPEPVETVEYGAVVFSCESPNCENEPNGSKGFMEGATVTSYAANGTELGSCITGTNGCVEAIPVPSDLSGSFSVTPGPGFENYLLASTTPEIVNEAGTVLGWTFLPPADVEPETAIMTVNACEDTGCTSVALMNGAVITAYAADGTEVDSCEIVVTEDQADYLGCALTLPGEDGTFSIGFGPGYEDYELVSDQPEITDAGERGLLYIWTATPTDAPPATETPAATEPAVPSKDDGVTALPATGTGHQVSAADVPGILAVGIVASGLAMTGLGILLRLRRQ